MQYFSQFSNISLKIIGFLQIDYRCVLNPLQEPQKIDYTQFLFAKQIFFSLSPFKFAASSVPHIALIV